MGDSFSPDAPTGTTAATAAQPVVTSCETLANIAGKYSIVLLAIGGATVLKLLLQLIIEEESPFLLFFAAVIVSAWYGGFSAGVFAAVLAALTSDYLFLPPRYSPLPGTAGQTLQLLIFMAESLVVVFVCSALRGAKNRAEHGEAMLRASEERYRAFVAQSSEGIWRFEARVPLDTRLPPDEQIARILAHGYLAECNDEMARMYGFARADEITGAPLNQFFDPQRAETLAYLRAFIESGYRLIDAESIELTKDGEERHFSNNLIGIVEAGALRRAWGTQRDITERKIAEAGRAALLEREQVARRNAEQANTTKDEFLATLSHELRTPLTPIIGWLQMMRGGSIPQAEFGYGLDVINRNASALLGLINDLLDTSALLSGKLRFDFAPVNLAAVLRAAAEATRAAATRRNIQIELRLPEDARASSRDSLLVHGDRARLVQLFAKLLDNAVKFSDDGARITMSCAVDDESIAVHVEDAGRGIPPDFLPHIFSRFRQADQTTTRAHGGLGLGLALVKSVAEAHGGTVTATSDGTGHGSRFTVLLPRKSNWQQSQSGSDGG